MYACLCYMCMHWGVQHLIPPSIVSGVSAVEVQVGTLTSCLLDTWGRYKRIMFIADFGILHHSLFLCLCSTGLKVHGEIGVNGVHWVFLIQEVPFLFNFFNSHLFMYYCTVWWLWFLRLFLTVFIQRNKVYMKLICIFLVHLTSQMPLFVLYICSDIS